MAWMRKGDIDGRRDSSAPAPVGPWEPSVLVHFLLLWKDIMITKRNLGRKRVFMAYTSMSWSITEEGLSLESGQELKAGILSRKHGRKLLTGLHKCLFSSIFIMEARSTCLVMVSPIMGCSLPYQSSIKTIPRTYDHRPIWLRQLINWSSFLLGDSKLCQVDNNNSLEHHF